MIRLVTKGKGIDATSAAMVRGIPYIFERMVDSDRQSVGHCPDGYLSSVLRWFAEPTVCKEGEGYPIGTLLWYRSPEWIAPDEDSPVEVSNRVTVDIDAREDS